MDKESLHNIKRVDHNYIEFATIGIAFLAVLGIGAFMFLRPPKQRKIKAVLG